MEICHETVALPLIPKVHSRIMTQNYSGHTSSAACQLIKSTRYLSVVYFAPPKEEVHEEKSEQH